MAIVRFLDQVPVGVYNVDPNNGGSGTIDHCVEVSISISITISIDILVLVLVLPNFHGLNSGLSKKSNIAS
jgi:hypothetical protein